MDERQRRIWMVDDPVSGSMDLAVVSTNYLRELEAIVGELADTFEHGNNDPLDISDHLHTLVFRARKALR